MRLLSALILLLLCAPPTTALAATDEEEGQALAARQRHQKPIEDLSTSGSLRRRDTQGNWIAPVEVRMELATGETNWQSIYVISNTNQVPLERLIVWHNLDGPNRYEYTRFAGEGQARETKTLAGPEAVLPLANSDFWLCDLGLEFFHWPGQKLKKKEMRKGRSCRVLESTQPDPGKGYARVLSWIDFESGALIRAEAYDAAGKLLKEFSIGSVSKVNDRWQLKSMEIRDEKTDTRTKIEFELEVQE
jgi:outer membrane lipoprotein-sorting protein